MGYITNKHQSAQHELVVTGDTFDNTNRVMMHKIIVVNQSTREFVASCFAQPTTLNK